MNSIKFVPGNDIGIKDVRNSRANIMFKKNMKIANEGYTLTHQIGHGNFG
jgi:hypothetical protein